MLNIDFATSYVMEKLLGERGENTTVLLTSCKNGFTFQKAPFSLISISKIIDEVISLL